ncbi:MAG: MlaD family protein [Solirubrobacteraceae bacterium]
MRRTVAPTLVVALIVAGVVIATRASPGSRDYMVAARFDDAGAIVAGEDVEVDGGVVGTVESLGLTRDYKAVLTLRIDKRQWTPFHQDASCTIRSQGVLAVEFVDCQPGTDGSPPLPAGPGGVHVLGVQHTSSPIEVDLVTNIMREPAGQYFATLLDELGTGLAARGSDLGAVLRRSNPGLAATDHVLHILGHQNRSLEALASSASAVLRPLVTKRAALARFVAAAEVTAQAPAQQSANVERSITRLPTFLRKLRATLAQLGALSDQGLPVLAALHATAPSLDDAIVALRPFSRRGLPAVRSLGTLTETATPALERSRTLIKDTAKLGANLLPASRNLSALTASFEQQGGITHLLQLLFYSTNSVNGFDSAGHYARAELLSGACSEYTARGYFGCASQFGGTSQVAKPIAADTGAAPQVTKAVMRTAPEAAQTMRATVVKRLLSYLVGGR